MKVALAATLLVALSAPAVAIAGDAPWSFAVLGDNRDDPDSVFPAIVERIHADDLVFVLHLGDMVRSGGAGQLTGFLEATAPIRGCFFPVIGNHELRRDPERRDFRAAFGLKGTSYSFTTRNVHVAVIDDASQEFPHRVLAWLDADLEAHAKGRGGIERVFVAMHIPPAGFGLETYVEGDKADRFERGSRALLDLLRRHAVDLVLAGHVHDARTVDVPGGPRLVVSGAAGAPQPWTRHPRYGYHRVTVSGSEVRVEFVAVKRGERMGPGAGAPRPACPSVERFAAE